MTFIEKLRLIERIDLLIRMKATGTADQLSNRLGISRSTLYEILECMRNMDAEIAYCRDRCTFYYETDKILAIGFVDKTKVRGGAKNIIQHFDFVRIFRTNSGYLCSEAG
jgi:hypothetical protein